MVPRHNVYHGLALTATQGMTQGGLVSPTLFNVVVENIVKIWFAMTAEDQRVDHDWLGGAVSRCLGVCYLNDGTVVSRDPEWLLYSMSVLVGLFLQYGLAANVTKYCTMKYQPGALRLGILAEAKYLKCKGVGDSYHVRIRRRITCPECGFELTVGSMIAHRCQMHGT